MSPPSRDSLEIAVGRLTVKVESIADAILTLDRKVDTIGSDVLRCIAQIPHLVSREDCAREMAAACSDLKDRMDGKREVTGVHRTLPEIQASVALERQAPRNGARTARVVLAIVAGLLALISFGSCVGVQLYRTNQGLERLERIVEANGSSR